MKAFELLTVTECALKHVNHRQEFHGEEKVLAVDLNFEKEGPNDLLDLIDPEIRLALYKNAAGNDGQVDLPGAIAILPNLRMPQLNGQKFKWHGNDKFKGYGFVLDYGLGDDKSNVAFTDAAVGKFWFETKEGGTVVLGWQVSYAGDGITDEILFKLIKHEQEKVHIQLNAPAVLQLVKGGKAKPAADGGGEQQEDLLDGEGDVEGDDDAPGADTPEGRLLAMGG